MCLDVRTCMCLAVCICICLAVRICMCLVVCICMCLAVCICTCLAMCDCMCLAMCISEFLITFEAWAKLAQQWLVSAPLGIHFEPINKELMLLVTI